MRLFILRAGETVPEIAARRGEFGDWIRAGVGETWGGAWAEHDLRDTDAALPPLDAASGFIITGSASSVTERAPWMLRAEEYVRRIATARSPLLGICFGHQLVAEALGGEVAKNPMGREIGTVSALRVHDDPLFEGLPRALTVSATHVDAVTRAPSRARVLATTSLDPVAAFAVDENVRCVQFHPEIDGDVMRGYLRARAHLVREEGGDPDALLARVEDDTHGPAILRNFVRRFVAR